MPADRRRPNSLLLHCLLVSLLACQGRAPSSLDVSPAAYQAALAALSQRHPKVQWVNPYAIAIGPDSVSLPGDLSTHYLGRSPAIAAAAARSPALALCPLAEPGPCRDVSGFMTVSRPDGSESLMTVWATVVEGLPNSPTLEYYRVKLRQQEDGAWTVLSAESLGVEEAGEPPA